MFNYFNRMQNEMKYTLPYKERLEKRTMEICQGINCTFDDMLNLETLARMSVPIDKLKIATIKIVSKFSDDYEEFIRARFFRGMSPEEFENDAQIMMIFNDIKESIRNEWVEEKYSDYDQNLPLRESFFKPGNNKDKQK